MFKRYRVWLIGAVIFQLLAAFTHSITLFISPPPSSDSERQLNEIIRSFHPDLGPGFHPSFADLVTALSSCFTFVCLLGGLTLGYMLMKHAELPLMRGLTAINLFVFGVLLAVVLWFTFLIPVAFIALIFVNLLIGFLLMSNDDPVG